ncbi:MAG: hypothetical protein ACRD3N_07445 [Terracidiphilus sp.]
MELTYEFKNWWDFPIEIEARTTAKLAAEYLCGAEPVEAYIQCRIDAPVTSNDVEDWEFVKKIKTSGPYSLAEGTKPLVQRYRGWLEAALQRHAGDEDFANVGFDA